MGFKIKEIKTIITPNVFILLNLWPILWAYQQHFILLYLSQYCYNTKQSIPTLSYYSNGKIFSFMFP